MDQEVTVEALKGKTIHTPHGPTYCKEELSIYSCNANGSDFSITLYTDGYRTGMDWSGVEWTGMNSTEVVRRSMKGFEQLQVDPSWRCASFSR